MSQTLLIHILGSADTHQLITRCLAKTNLSHKVVHIDPTDYLDYLEKNIKAPSDVLFVDNESEEVSSIKLIYELRQQIKTPIIFLTKRENKSLIKSAFKKGAAYYLVKCDLEANLLEHAIYYATQNIEHAKIIQEVTNRYDMILNTVDEGLVELDLQGKVTFMNASAEYTLGWKRTELIGKHISNFYGLAHQNKNKRAWKTHPIYFSAKDSKSYECYEATFKCLDERKIKVKYTSAPIIINGELENILLVFKNITQEVQSEAQLQYLARHDTLTGLYNRSEFNNHLTNAIERAKRSSTELHYYL